MCIRDSLRDIGINSSEVWYDPTLPGYPQLPLTKDDVMLCSLISMGFPTHAIATIFRLTNEMSIYNKRERLRTRLEMEEGSNLTDYLDEKVALLRNQKALLYSNIFSSLGKKDYI